MVNYLKAKFIKMIILLFILTGIFIMFFSCCNSLFSDEELTLQRTDYTGNELRIDGYYYYFVKGTNRTVIYFLYRNGVALWGGTYATTNLNEIEMKMIELYSGIRKMKGSWGVFIVDDNKIQHEEWVEAPSGVRLAIFRRSGYIENDTTIHFTESFYSGRNETKPINQIWHFKQFDNKPDSTNSFIK